MFYDDEEKKEDKAVPFIPVATGGTEKAPLESKGEKREVPVARMQPKRTPSLREEASRAPMWIEDPYNYDEDNTDDEDSIEANIREAMIEDERFTVQPKTQQECDRECVSSLGLDITKWKDVKKLKDMGFGIKRLLNLGVDPKLITGDWWITRLFTGKFSKKEVELAQLSVSERKAKGATVKQLLKEGYSPKEIFMGYCFTVAELKKAGITAEKLRKKEFNLRKWNKNPAYLFLYLGFTIEELHEADFPDLVIQSRWYLGEQYEEEEQEYKQKGVKENDYKPALDKKYQEESIKMIRELMKADCSLKDLIEAGYSQTEIVMSGRFSFVDVKKAGITAKQLRTEKFNLGELKKKLEGNNILENIAWGYLYLGFTIKELHDAGFPNLVINSRWYLNARYEDK